MWPELLKLAAGHDIVRPVDTEAGRSFWDLYAPIACGNGRSPFVVGQLGQSLDGRIATPTGRSHYINGPESIRHLHCLRALVDAVIVGIGTVVADDPQLTVRKVEGRDPARVVIDPNGRLPPDARILADDGCPVFVVQGCDRPRPSWVTPITVQPREGNLVPAAIVAALADRGFRRLLVEGGAGTVSGFLAARAIDRLHLCIAPIVIGSGPIGITLPPIDELHHAIRPQTSVHRLGMDMLFDCLLEPRAAAFAADSLQLDGVER
ncbi:MAG: bifunctional deaminase-reductase protein [Rhodospirillales bacterium]|nr:bifunctional deaminase-reductase protein [Rhodospirillales bacterium]